MFKRITYFTLGFLTAAAILPGVALYRLERLNEEWEWFTEVAYENGCVVGKHAPTSDCRKAAKSWENKLFPILPRKTASQ